MSEMGIRGVHWEPHHVLFEANAWSSNREGLKLRETPELVIPMFIAPHDELHRVVPFVPLLDAFHVYLVSTAFRRKDTPLKNVAELLRCLNVSIERFDTEENSTDLNNVLRVRVGELAIKAIEEQIPHISDGIYEQVSDEISERALKPKVKRSKVDRRRGGRLC